ncbi:RNA ligase family protein [uncultured Gimesia sp.]|uniref:RNA ligase family protein n=1 Tax=uncultured Gimesia sp. TaxID=1678688 RepID=UPI0030DB0A74|tara:strand:- start:70930 stop:71712 length:783 start_codon:yes stop_codon:yes gene_type:complete
MRVTRELDLRKLNSATKYPSIPTYHAMGERGALLEEVVDFGGKDLIATEKVDGTNSRIILMPDGCYLIGSREELLHARGDLIHNPALGIVETLKQTAERIVSTFSTASDVITVVYLETYGGKTTVAAKQYTSKREFGYRVFDVSRVSVKHLDTNLEAIAAWRENAGQTFLDERELTEFVRSLQLELTPRIQIRETLPTTIVETQMWLQSMLPDTLVSLDAKAGGKPEGLVVRTSDRGRIAKIRFEDYARHQKRAVRKKGS